MYGCKQNNQVKHLNKLQQLQNATTQQNKRKIKKRGEGRHTKEEDEERRKERKLEA